MLPPLDELLEPISPEAPGGEDLRGHTVFEELRRRRPPRTLDDLGRGGIALRARKFDAVRSLAEEILIGRSKDLQVAAWLTEAWVQLEGAAGLVHGLELQRRLVDEFWETVHPLPEPVSDAARLKPLSWAADALRESLEAIPITETDETVEPLLGLLKRRDGGLAGLDDVPWIDEVHRAVLATPHSFWERLGFDLLQALIGIDALRTTVRRRGLSRLLDDVGIAEFLQNDFGRLRAGVLEVGWLIGVLSRWKRDHQRAAEPSALKHRMSTAAEALSVESLLRPISDDAPAGEDLRYEAIYAEIRGLRKPHQVGDPDWRLRDLQAVRGLAEGVLRHRSKDLQIAAWLTEAWLHLEGVDGLIAGLELQRRLLGEYWRDVHPRLEPGDPAVRLAPVRWTADYLAPSLWSIRVTDEGATAQDAARHMREGEAGDVETEAFRRRVADRPAAHWQALYSGLESARAALRALESTVAESFTSDLWDPDVSDEWWPTDLRLRRLEGEIDRVLGVVRELPEWAGAPGRG